MLLLKGYTGCFKKLLVRSPAAPHRKKEKKKADRKVPDRPVVVKGERLLKKKKNPFRHSQSFWDRVGYDHLHSDFVGSTSVITKFPKGN
jgi:hypothetical protein